MKTQTLSKKLFGFLFTVAAFAELSGCASQDVAEDNAALVVSAYDKVLNQHDTKTLEAVFAEDYIQHNPQVADGRDGLAQYVQFLATMPAAHLEVKRVIAQGDLVMLHVQATDTAEQRGNDHTGRAIVDIFRVANGKIVEHWDVIQNVPATSANGHSMFDGSDLYQGAAK